jgi:hypothetical protein
MNIPKRFWSEVVLTAVHLMNKLLSPVLDNKSPIEILKMKKSILTILGYLNVHVLYISSDMTSLIKMH